jgi:hypothetical protein
MNGFYFGSFLVTLLCGKSVECKMKYVHEYYQKLYIPINQNVTTSNSKGYIRVKNQ